MHPAAGEHTRPASELASVWARSRLVADRLDEGEQSQALTTSVTCDERANAETRERVGCVEGNALVVCRHWNGARNVWARAVTNVSRGKFAIWKSGRQLARRLAGAAHFRFNWFELVADEHARCRRRSP